MNEDFDVWFFVFLAVGIIGLVGFLTLSWAVAMGM